MGGVKSKVNVDAVQKEVNNESIVIYTKNACNFCTKAKDLLSEIKIPYKEVDLDDLKIKQPNDYLGIVNGLVYTTRQTSVPQIFICGKFVGGFTELDALRSSGHLLEAISQCIENYEEFERINALSGGKLRHLLVGSPSGYEWNATTETILEHEAKWKTEDEIVIDAKMLPKSKRPEFELEKWPSKLEDAKTRFLREFGGGKYEEAEEKREIEAN